MFPEETQKQGCELLIAGAHPVENMVSYTAEQIAHAPREEPLENWARSEVFVFCGPNFEPQQAEMGTVVSIGSGNYVDVYLARAWKGWG